MHCLLVNCVNPECVEHNSLYILKGRKFCKTNFNGQKQFVFVLNNYNAIDSSYGVFFWHEAQSTMANCLFLVFTISKNIQIFCLFILKLVFISIQSEAVLM